MNVIVTGGCGFIGSHVVDYLLKKKFSVHIIDNLTRGKYIWRNHPNKPVLHKSDITDKYAIKKLFQKVNPSKVYHLAANHYIPYCEENPYETFNINVYGTLNILEASLSSKNIEKFFFASTGDVYGPAHYPHRETDITSPIYIYGESKLISENIIKRYISSGKYNLDITIGRLFNAIGPRETNPHFLPEVVRQISENKKIIEVGNLWPMRDFVDVFSMSRIIVDLTDKNCGIDIFNIGSGKPQTVEDALSIISKGNIEINSVEHRKRANDRPFLSPNTDKLKKILGDVCLPLNNKTSEMIWALPKKERYYYK